MHTAAKWGWATRGAVVGARRLGLAVLLAGGLSAGGLRIGTAAAGDFAHECRSADGGYAMNDEQLRALDIATGRETGPAISYKVLRRVDLSKTAGVCISRAAPKGQRRFGYEATTYAIKVRFRRGGSRIETFLICDMASSGLPAAYNCDEDIQTQKWTIGNVASAPAVKIGAATKPVWMHEGSRMRIEANGRGRRVVFVEPSERLVSIGVVPGDPLFEGRRKGNRYIGKAYVYSTRCGATSYSVSGRVRAGERRVEMTGRRPVRNRDCRTISRRNVRLVLDRK